MSLNLKVAALIFLGAVAVEAQVNHKYPRLGFNQWSGAPVEWYAQFDLIMTAYIDPDWARRVKSINPEAFILPTSDWNAGTYVSPFPEDWYLRHADGSRVELYGAGSYFANLSDICPRYSQNGKRLCDYLPEFLVQRVDLSVFDGIATDGLYYADPQYMKWHPLAKQFNWDVDLDGNRKNDFEEHGEQWVSDHWNAGVDIIFTKLRQLMPPQKLLLINSGTWHYHNHDKTNGIYLEHSSGGTEWSWFSSTYNEFMQTLREPHIIFFDYDGESKNEFRDMRFQLTVTLYGDAYFSYSDPGSHEHYYNKFYDEFLVDLGYPRGPAQEIGSTGVLVRYFDHGASVVNVSGSPQTVSNNDLRSLSGYQGPYYRFQGGQDPGHNNGQLFDNITIWGGSDNTGPIGDGYLLLRSPRAVICDIIIDNVDMGTSPGTTVPEFIGAWTQYPDPISGNPYYAMRVADWFGMYAYAYTSSGQGESRAIYRPTIGYAGYYEVFEWHGWHESAVDDEADNVPYTIKYHNGEISGRIDETRNFGRWNSLGTYFFNVGTSGYLELSNNANGIVIADAIKFAFKGDNPDADITPPNAPVGIKVRKP